MGAWNESSKGFAPGANTAPVRSSASRRYAPAHAPCRAGMEVRLRMVHARHRYPGCKRHPVPVWRSASRGYGGLPPEGMESCLQTMRMRHRSPAWRESSRRSAPAARVLLVLLGINNIRKQRGYRCRFVVSSVGASTCNYRGVMRFFRGAHDPNHDRRKECHIPHNGMCTVIYFVIIHSRWDSVRLTLRTAATIKSGRQGS